MMRIFDIGTSGIILHSSTLIYRLGTWDLKKSFQNQQSKIFHFKKQTPSSRALTVKPTAQKLDLMGITHMLKILGVLHFKLVHEGIKVAINSVNLTQFG